MITTDKKMRYVSGIFLIGALLIGAIPAAAASKSWTVGQSEHAVATTMKGMGQTQWVLQNGLYYCALYGPYHLKFLFVASTNALAADYQIPWSVRGNNAAVQAGDDGTLHLFALTEVVAGSRAMSFVENEWGKSSSMSSFNVTKQFGHWTVSVLWAYKLSTSIGEVGEFAVAYRR